MSVTLRDVARHCGLSPSTVSGVLNHRSGTWASKETRRKIFEAAATLGYRPHHAARVLRTGRTRSVAFIVNRDSPALGFSFDGAATIIAERLSEDHFELSLEVFATQQQLMTGLMDLVNRHSCDAVLLFGRETDVQEQGKFLEERKFPFVVKGLHEREHPHWYQVDYDHAGMMRRAVEFLVAKGHQRIAYLGYPGQEVYQWCLYQGFCEAIHACCGGDPVPEFLGILLEENFRPGSTLIAPGMPCEAYLERWFSLPADRQPTAVVMGTGENEWRIIEKFLAYRRKTIGYGPDQFAVVGQAGKGLYLAFGHGHCFADTSYVSIAEAAVDALLVPLLSGKEPTSPVHRILPELVPTHSLGLGDLFSGYKAQ